MHGILPPWLSPRDTTRTGTGSFRTFASPRIGGVLHGTCEFEARTGKRYDDTDLIISEIIEHGFDGPRGAWPSRA
ncbi:MAG: hypothetical protein IPJ43_13160 [Saprospiraceae bacterium]|nr:hypothetical protein [Saprospiraceae bacterium]